VRVFNRSRRSKKTNVRFCQIEAWKKSNVWARGTANESLVFLTANIYAAVLSVYDHAAKLLSKSQKAVKSELGITEDLLASLSRVSGWQWHSKNGRRRKIVEALNDAVRDPETDLGCAL